MRSSYFWAKKIRMDLRFFPFFSGFFFAVLVYCLFISIPQTLYVNQKKKKKMKNMFYIVFCRFGPFAMVQFIESPSKTEVMIPHTCTIFASVVLTLSFCHCSTMRLIKNNRYVFIDWSQNSIFCLNEHKLIVFPLTVRPNKPITKLANDYYQ